MEFLPEHWSLILDYMIGYRWNIHDHILTMICTHMRDSVRLKRIQHTEEHYSLYPEDLIPLDSEDTRQTHVQTTLLEIDHTCHRILLRYALYIHFGYTENASTSTLRVLEEWLYFVEYNIHALKHFDSANDRNPWIEFADRPRYNALMSRVQWHEDTIETFNTMIRYRNKHYKWMRNIPKPIHYSER